MTAKILVYGSYGYSGDLVARFAKDDGVEVVLSGRNAERLQAQAQRYGLPWVAADLGEPASIRDALADKDVVIHCAGPFAHTYEAMVEACLDTGTHYTDITGEANVFEGLWAMDARATAAGVMLLPGTGFDVVPSDCLGAHLKARCPEATHLALAFRGRGGGVSHGTATTMAENFSQGGLVREDGALKPVPTAWETRDIDFGDGKPAHCMTIPWGDVVTAYKSTAIPNIKVYTEAPARAAKTLRLIRPLLPLLATGPVQRLIKKRIDAAPPGPDDEARARAFMELWGEAIGPGGAKVVSRLKTPEGYTLTAKMALAIAVKVTQGLITPGFQTPSSAYGKDLILELPGVERTDA
ncbi:MAG: saccharopine dehydrogenase NADP-binding domain-containing protein [Myxococcota bacterium]